MRIRIACLLAFVLLAAAQAENVDSYTRLKALFPNPPAEFSTLPFFVWNGEMTRAEIDRVLKDYVSQGVRGFFIHPRPGMITPYLDDNWFALVRYTVDQAKKLGMQAWLYDENSYPSGFAGGNVPARMPESYNQGQGLVRRDTGPCKILLKPSGDGFAKADPNSSFGAESYCFAVTHYPASGWTGGFPYVDLLVPGVTQKFIEVTMPGYEKTLGRDLGTVTPGIFTDEPNIAPPDREAIKYTPDLFEQFRKRWGYDLETRLPSLYDETGEWRKVRHDFYGLLLELFIERWSKPWNEYATKKGFVWTGHYWEHEWPQPRNGPDHMAMYAWHQVPAIDMLFNQFNEGVNAQFGNVRAIKELSSVANQIGRRRTLSETYGGAGWELRFEDMKRLGDWEYVLGVNMMNQHLSFQTLAGARKYDYPQSFTYHEPWWPHYHVLANYFARLSLALASGEQVNRILVLEPTTSAWMYAGARPNARMMQIGDQFQAFVTQLEHAQVEYDLGSENILKTHGKVSGAGFVVGRRTYDTVILPPGTENLDSATAALIRQFVAGGGKLLSFGSEKPLINGAPGDLTLAAATAPPSNSDFVGVEGNVFHQRRQLDGGEIWFFVNFDLETSARATVKAAGASLEKLDAFTGRAEPYPAKAQSGRMEFTVALPPAGSLLLVARNVPGPAAKPEVKLAEKPVDASGPVAVRRLEPNAIRIDYCDLTFNGSTEPDMYFYKAADRIYKAYGFKEGNPWNTAVQYKTSILDRDRFDANSGFDAAFHFDVAERVNVASLRAVVERPALWKVSVNGAAVESLPRQWWLDTGFGVYEIGKHVKPGRNTIQISARPMRIHNELEPVYITGDFGAEPQDRGFRLVPAGAVSMGAWKTQNLPFYSGRASPTVARSGSAGGENHRVALGAWGGTLAEVRVNGKSAGIVGWKPYELPLGSLAAGGETKVEGGRLRFAQEPAGPPPRQDQPRADRARRLPRRSGPHAGRRRLRPGAVRPDGRLPGARVERR